MRKPFLSKKTVIKTSSHPKNTKWAVLNHSGSVVYPAGTREDAYEFTNAHPDEKFHVISYSLSEELKEIQERIRYIYAENLQLANKDKILRILRDSQNNIIDQQQSVLDKLQKLDNIKEELEQTRESDWSHENLSRLLDKFGFITGDERFKTYGSERLRIFSFYRVRNRPILKGKWLTEFLSFVNSFIELEEGKRDLVFSLAKRLESGQYLSFVLLMGEIFRNLELQTAELAEAYFNILFNWRITRIRIEIAGTNEELNYVKALYREIYSRLKEKVEQGWTSYNLIIQRFRGDLRDKIPHDLYLKLNPYGPGYIFRIPDFLKEWCGEEISSERIEHIHSFFEFVDYELPEPRDDSEWEEYRQEDADYESEFDNIIARKRGELAGIITTK